MFVPARNVPFLSLQVVGYRILWILTLRYSESHGIDIYDFRKSVNSFQMYRYGFLGIWLLKFVRCRNKKGTFRARTDIPSMISLIAGRDFLLGTWFYYLKVPIRISKTESYFWYVVWLVYSKSLSACKSVVALCLIEYLTSDEALFWS